LGFLTSLFGGEGTSLWGAAFALIFVLILIVAGVWLLKLLFNASGSVARGRNRRLAVIDTLSLDGKRNLVLVRRDDVEHLIVVGGSNDVLVESGIETPSATQRPERTSRGSEPAPSPAAGQAANHNRQPRTPQEQTAAASRLGVTGLLRRYGNEEPRPAEPAPEPSVEATRPHEPHGPGDRLRAMQRHKAEPEEHHGRALRHTGLLKTSPVDAQEFPVEVENPAPHLPDSARNARDEADAEAMASIEEGATSEHGSAGDNEEFRHDGNRERHN